MTDSTLVPYAAASLEVEEVSASENDSPKIPNDGKKTYVLDTSALLSGGKRALSAFGDNHVVIPLDVVKELEKKRNDPLLGFTARQVLRELERYRVKLAGDLKAGVVINGQNGTVRIEVNHVNQRHLPEGMRNSSYDMRILAVAKNLSVDEGQDVILVSNDLPLRIHAETVAELRAEELVLDKVSRNWNGIVSAEVDNEALQQVFNGESVTLDDLSIPAHQVAVNTALVLRAGSSSAIATYQNGAVKQLSRNVDTVCGVNPRSSEQKFALHYLLDPKVEAVSLGGNAGTGKSMLALAAGIEQVLEGGTSSGYLKVVVFRPLHAVGGQNLGYLPGTEEEKMNPWGAAVHDTLESFLDKNVREDIISRGRLEVLPVTHIRGRTFTRSFIIVDEAQNLELDVLLAVLSRAGAGTKVVFSWDAAQSDNLSIGTHDGMAAIVERMKQEKLFAHVTLRRSERSPLAEMAGRVLGELSG